MQALDRVVDVIETVGALGSATVSDVAANSGLHKSTASRLLAALRSRGWVQQNAAGCYSLGPKLLILAQSAVPHVDLRAVARPNIEALERSIGEDVHLGVLVGGRVLCIDLVESTQLIRMYYPVGTLAPAHATAIGKSLLAYAQESVVQQTIEEVGLRKFTDRTITIPAKLWAELAEVRRRGFAVDDEESGEQVRCVGAPVFGPDGGIVAAISVSGAAFRLVDERLGEVAARVMDTAWTISRQLGCPSAVRPVESRNVVPQNVH